MGKIKNNRPVQAPAKEGRGESDLRHERLMAAREKVRQAKMELLEVDDMYVSVVESQLKHMVFADKILLFIGAGVPAMPLRVDDVCHDLGFQYDIHIPPENVTIDFEKMLCFIKLNERVTVTVQMKNAIGVKSIIPPKFK